MLNTAASAAATVAEAVGDRAKEAASRAKEVAEAVGDRAKESASNVGNTASAESRKVVYVAQEEAEQTKEQVGEESSELLDVVNEEVDKVEEEVRDAINEFEENKAILLDKANIKIDNFKNNFQSEILPFIESNFSKIIEDLSQIKFIIQETNQDFKNFQTNLNNFIESCRIPQDEKNFFLNLLKNIIQIINEDTKHNKTLSNLVKNKESVDKVEATSINYMKYFFENHLSLIEPVLSVIINNLDENPNDPDIIKNLKNSGILEKKFIVKKLTKINKYIKKLKVQDIDETNYLTKLPLLLKSLIEIYYHLYNELQLIREASIVLDCNNCKLENVFDKTINPNYNMQCSKDCKNIIKEISNRFM